MPLPGVVERGLGSLVALEARDERSDTKVTGEVSENGRNDRRSVRASLKVVRGGRVPKVLVGGTQTRADNGGSTESGKPAGDGGGTGNTPAGGDPEGDGGSAGPPATPESPRNPQAAPTPDPPTGPA